MRIYRITKKAGHFLETPESAWEWAKYNVDVEVTEEDLSGDNDEDQSRIEAMLESYHHACQAYSERYLEVMDAPTVQIYRAIRAPSVQHIDWDNVGTHWSFVLGGAGSYGDIPPKWRKCGDIIVTGIVNTKDIDWEYCFTSFMYYGTDQWECALDDGAPVTIVAINGEKANINAIAENV